jgi:predicted HTH domain antitoxin
MPAPARTIQISVALPWENGGEPDLPALGRELRLLWIIEEVRQRRLGVGKGAGLAGMPRAAFMRTLGEHGVPVIDYSIDDLDRELGVLPRG